MKQDEFNKQNIDNTDGRLNVDESPLKNIKEVQQVPEVEKSEDEVFQSSEENKVEEENGKRSFDNADNSSGDSSSSSSASSAGASSAASTVGVVGGIAAVVAVSAVMVLGVVKLPIIPAVDVDLINASATTLAFALSTNIEDHTDLTITLKGAGYEMTTPFQEYVKFVDLKQNDVYTLSVYQNESSRFSSKYYTNDKADIENITITVTSYIDNELHFYFEDKEPGEKNYTVNVKNKSGTVIFKDDTSTPKEYTIDNFVEDVAIFVSVNGTISAGVQVFKPVYDYNNIQWIWGEYGEDVTAIIPSLNGTSDYYVRDIRNFEISREDPDCTNDGKVVRQAAFIGPDRNRYEDLREFVLPASGHDFSDVTYIWSENYETCHAEAVCPICGTEIVENVMCEMEEVETETGISYTKYTAPFQNEYFSVRYHYEDLVYGSYPQSRVISTGVIEDLNELYGDPITQAGKWSSYGYYAEGVKQDYMYYVDADVDEDGTFDYRGVYFTDYRPINTTDELGNTSYQYDNGYETNTAYWFNYEPIRWNVLDHDGNNLFISSEIILDSQSFYHEMAEDSFAHNGGTGYANNYELSDIRSWLNEEFYSSALAGAEVINTTLVDNSLASTLDSANPYTCNDSEDKVFLLSRYENKEYLSSTDTAIVGSDYAKVQGLYIAPSNDKGFWGLRTPYPNASYQMRYITNTGNVSYDSINKTSQGVRPACWINID